MTTKITITCQQDSHWDLKVITQDFVKNQSDPNSGGWESHPIIIPQKLGPGDTAHLHVWDTRRYIIEEGERT